MMKNKLPCETVQDLLPSYIDGLTSDVSNRLIETHLDGCDTCRRVMKTMKEPSAEPVDTGNSKEIDFLKKTRKKTKKVILGSILGTVLVMAVLMAIKVFLTGNVMNHEYVACDVQVSGNTLSLSGAVADEKLGISSIDFSEDSGVVTVVFRSVRRSLFHGGDFEAVYTAGEKIKEVRLDDRIIWADGAYISAITSAVWQTGHPYIGDMPANGRTAGALNIGNYLGVYKNELQTDAKPYGWKLILENGFSGRRRESMENVMRSYAYVLLAVIDNLGEVSYEYMIDGQTCVLDVTAEDATAYAGQDIKTAGQDIHALQKLMEKTGLTDMSYAEKGELSAGDTIRLEMVNLTSEEISNISIDFYKGGTLCGTQSGGNADNSLIKKGQIMNFVLLPADFTGAAWPGQETITLEVTITDAGGKAHHALGKINMAAEFGCTYRYNISGSAKDGYTVSQ